MRGTSAEVAGKALSLQSEGGMGSPLLPHAVRKRVIQLNKKITRRGKKMLVFIASTLVPD